MFFDRSTTLTEIIFAELHQRSKIASYCLLLFWLVEHNYFLKFIWCKWIFFSFFTEIWLWTISSSCILEIKYILCEKQPMPLNNEVCGSSYVEHHLRTLSLSVPPYNCSNVSCINWFTRDQRPLQVAFFLFFPLMYEILSFFLRFSCSLVNRSLFRSLFYKTLMSGVEESRFFDDQYRPCKRFKTKGY